jgi:hypothetical protein
MHLCAHTCYEDKATSLAEIILLLITPYYYHERERERERHYYMLRERERERDYYMLNEIILQHSTSYYYYISHITTC